jgi:type IV secretory pathway VirB10-like protein
MVDVPANATYTDGGLTLYDQARVAGFSEDEVKHLKPPEAEQPQKPEQPEQATPEVPAPTKPAPAVPPPPDPVPGVYNPEQQQNALRAADSIADPEMRMKVKSNLKREYANDAMMDGITAKAREEGTKKAVSSYSTAIQQLRDDPKMPLAQKQALVKMLTKTMWQDPRTDYGETRGHLEKFMQQIAFGEDQDDLGSNRLASRS